jgi:hypothetical protein
MPDAGSAIHASFLELRSRPAANTGNEFRGCRAAWPGNVTPVCVAFPSVRHWLETKASGLTTAATPQDGQRRRDIFNNSLVLLKLSILAQPVRELAMQRPATTILAGGQGGGFWPEPGSEPVATPEEFERSLAATPETHAQLACQ